MTGAAQDDLSDIVLAVDNEYETIGSDVERLLENDDITVDKTTAEEEFGALAAVRDGDADVALTRSDRAFLARHGYESVPLDAPDPIEGLRGLLTVSTAPVHLVVPADGAFDTLGDVHDELINIGEFGSATYADLRRIIRATGYTVRDFEEGDFGPDRGLSLLRAGEIAMTPVIGALPNALIADVSPGEVDLLELPAQGLRSAEMTDSWFTGATIPDGTYDGIDGDRKTVGVRSTLVTRADLDDEVVDSLLSVVLDEDATLEESGTAIDPSSARDGLPIQLHPAAATYYAREVCGAECWTGS